MRRKRHHRPTRCVGRDVAAPVYRGGVARVVELADTGGLNPPGSKEPCGFKSRPGHRRPDPLEVGPCTTMISRQT